jgi:uncharacterized protein with HEPN domain
MWDKELVNDLIELIIENLDTVKDRTKDIYCADDFSSNEQGMILLDSTCMKLAAIGESIKSLDKISNKQLLSNYPEVPWKQVMGMRDIIVHHYFDIDAEVILKTIKEDVPFLIKTLSKIYKELE